MSKPTLKGFKAWLDQQPDDRKIIVSDPYVCPIACYVKEAGIYADPDICGDTWVVRPRADNYDDDGYEKSPTWAQKFVAAVDTFGSPREVDYTWNEEKEEYEGHVEPWVTVAEAKEILAKCQKRS